MYLDFHVKSLIISIFAVDVLYSPKELWSKMQTTEGRPCWDTGEDVRGYSLLLDYLSAQNQVQNLIHQT